MNSSHSATRTAPRRIERAVRFHIVYHPRRTEQALLPNLFQNLTPPHLSAGNELYVANAGDSRCIICREGKAIDMSIDHKPEDAPELERITKAGGKVSNDGRINGGLNLSRAIGDHSYKQNKELNDKEQMITALPDVKTLTIDPVKDSFMVLACDGIWNFMSSQDVCDFILPRLEEGRERLSQICEEVNMLCFYFLHFIS